MLPNSSLTGSAQRVVGVSRVERDAMSLVGTVIAVTSPFLNLTGILFSELIRSSIDTSSPSLRM